MRKIVSRWIERYFSDEEALLLFVLLGVALLIIIGLGQTLTPVFAGIILAFLMQGGVNRLKKHSFGHLSAVILVFLAFIGAVGALLFIVMPLAWQQSVNLFNELPRIMSEIKEVLLLLPQRYPEMISEQRVLELIDLAATELSSMGQLVVTFSLNSITSVMALLIYLVLVPILVFFFLKDGASLAQYWTSFLPEKRDMMTKVWLEMDGQIANYIRGKVVEIFVVGVATYIAFLFLGINYAALLAILVGLSVLIPYIGAALVTLPVALIAFFQWGWGSDFMYLMLAYAIIQALDGNVLVPLLFSEAVNLHPVAIIIAVLVFGGFWGFWGLFFAIPLATLFKAVISAWPKVQTELSAESSTQEA